MTREQILLVKKTWNIFREIDPILVGDVFYSKLFFDMPYLEKLFQVFECKEKILISMSFLENNL